MTTKPMPMDFALAVQRLQRQGLNPAAIVVELQADEAYVMEAHRVLAMPVNDTQEPANQRTDAERAAELDRMPKRIVERIKRSRQ